MSERIDERAFCDRIMEVFPDVRECGIDLDVTFDDKKEMYLVQLNKGSRQVKTYIEPGDVKLCMDSSQCLALGVHLSQFRS